MILNRLRLPPPERADEANRPVLVVDDNTAMLKIVSRVISGRGYRVITATNVADAIAALDAARPPVVILDVNLGPEDGLEVLRKAKEYPGVSTVVLSGTAEGRILDRARSLGADRIMGKPFSIEEIMDFLKSVLG